MKPKIFIASSSETRNIAYCVQENLEDDAAVTVWNQGIFKLTKTAIDSLLEELDKFDFGIFVFSPDDGAIIRTKEKRVVRDNVVLELGLFLGRLGKERSFIIAPRGKDSFHWPSDLWGITVATFAPQSNDENLNAALGPACHKIRRAMAQVNTSDSNEPYLITKAKASDKLHERLQDKRIKNVVVLTYTNEVDFGLMTKYHVSGKKNIEIFKRSVVADLVEQQEINVERILNDQKVDFWDKRNKSQVATTVLETDFKSSKDVNISHFFYDKHPTRRAYIFDYSEALLAYYETINDPFQIDGSIYKGMGASPSLWITDNTPYGQFLLEELKNYVTSLKKTSRTLPEEERILSNPSRYSNSFKLPCIRPKAVFLDLDGVIYDSLPFYVQAWQDAFNEIQISLPEGEVYLHEGRSGTTTIELLVRKYLRRLVTENEIKKLKQKKNEVLNRLGRPPVQKGARQLVKAILNSDLDCWVVTGSSKDELMKHLQSDFGQIFTAKNVITGHDLKYGKPTPEPYLLAFERANVKPHESLIIENAPLGVESAARSRGFCIAVNTGILENDQLKASGARVIFPDCEKLAEKWLEIVKVLKM